MNRRDPEIFKALFEEILDRALKCAPRHKFRFHNPLYAIDSTMIDLCLNLYDWAHYRKNKGAIKLHTELDLSGDLPCFVMLSNGKMADIRAVRANIVIVPDCICTFDKGYYDRNWFQHITDNGAYFVTRLKDNAKSNLSDSTGRQMKDSAFGGMKSHGSPDIRQQKISRQIVAD